jgi:hypothetical protein
MNCLTDYIGLRGCSTTTPDSGLYVNDLPGISLKQIVSLTNEEEKTYLELWDMIQRRGQNRFSLDVREQMSKAYKIKSINQGINVNGISAGTGTIPSDGNYGFTIEYDTMNTGYVPSPMSFIHIQQIAFTADFSTLNANIYFIDIDKNQTILTLTKDIGYGNNLFEVNQTFTNVGRLFVGIHFDQGYSYTSIKAPSNYWTGCCGAIVRGAKLDMEYHFGQELYGFSPIFTVGCSWDGLICQNKNIFSRAFWYLLGIEILTEVIYSSKLNQFTTVNLQKANELRTEYQVEYMKALGQICSGMNLDCDCCLECGGSVQLIEANQFY